MESAISVTQVGYEASSSNPCVIIVTPAAPALMEQINARIITRINFITFIEGGGLNIPFLTHAESFSTRTDVVGPEEDFAVALASATAICSLAWKNRGESI